MEIKAKIIEVKDGLLKQIAVDDIVYNLSLVTKKFKSHKRKVDGLVGLSKKYGINIRREWIDLIRKTLNAEPNLAAKELEVECKLKAHQLMGTLDWLITKGQMVRTSDGTTYRYKMAY